jgi:hypothetical protein
VALLREGYIPRLTAWPPASALPNNASARDPANFKVIDQKIRKLLQSNAIKKLNYQPHVVAPLQLVFREGKEPRLILDVSRQINDFIAH